MMRLTDRNRHNRVRVLTPVGIVVLAFSVKGITEVGLPRRGKGACRGASPVRSNGHERGRSPAANRVALQVRRYFSGERVTFRLPLDLRQATDFQRAVWKATAKIPYGETRSYAWIAKQIGRPKAARAVGQALGANPVPVVIPCHRVISTAGTLGGFSGGLPMKRYLLGMEARPVCAEARRRKHKDR